LLLGISPLKALVFSICASSLGMSACSGDPRALALPEFAAAKHFWNATGCPSCLRVKSLFYDQ